MRLNIKSSNVIRTQDNSAEVEQQELIMSPVRRHLLAFIKLGIGEEYTFDCPVGDGDRLIQNMRVKLSKLKKKAIKAKRIIREFKMMVKDKKVVNGRDVITLLKTENGVTDLNEVIHDIMQYEGLTF